jgi:hypothetical protein
MSWWVASSTAASRPKFALSSLPASLAAWMVSSRSVTRRRVACRTGGAKGRKRARLRMARKTRPDAGHCWKTVETSPSRRARRQIFTSSILPVNQFGQTVPKVPSVATAVGLAASSDPIALNERVVTRVPS